MWMRYLSFCSPVLLVFVSRSILQYDWTIYCCGTKSLAVSIARNLGYPVTVHCSVIFVCMVKPLRAHVLPLVLCISIFETCVPPVTQHVLSALSHFSSRTYTLWFGGFHRGTGAEWLLQRPVWSTMFWQMVN